MCAEESRRPPPEPGFRPEDFEDPLGLLYAEHEWIRMCCERLVRLAEDPAAPEAPEIAASLLDYLENGLPLHRADEEEDLFPLLERRSPPEDKVVAVIELLRIEHRDDIERGRALVEPLREIAAGSKPADSALFTSYVRAFTLLQRRHQAMENNEVMPLAFDRLTAADKTELGRRMAARRGIPYPD